MIRNVVMQNIVVAMYNCCKSIIADSKKSLSFDSAENTILAQNLIELIGPDKPSEFDLDASMNLPEIKKIVFILARDSGVLNVLQSYKATFFHMSDGILHFFSPETLERIESVDYEPSYEDWLNCRLKTLGFKQLKIPIADKVEFTYIDVGGQRIERKKWINCFEGVDGLIYVVSLSDYDQVMYEDNKTNRMEDALMTFEKTVNGEWFRNTPLIILFNKKDVLKNKISLRDDLQFSFNEYQGGKDFNSAMEFISQMFLRRVKDNNRIKVTKFLQATDKEDVGLLLLEMKAQLMHVYGQTYK